MWHSSSPFSFDMSKLFSSKVCSAFELMASSGETPDLMLETGATASHHFLPLAAKLGFPLVSLGAKE